MAAAKFALGIIGGGVMAEAIASRLLTQQVYAANQVIVSEPQNSRQKFWQEKYGVAVTAKNHTVWHNAAVVLLAIKPQILELVIQELDLAITTPPLIISILAGISLKRLESAFVNYPVIRVMPNTPATVGAGISAIAAGKQVDSAHLDQGKTIFTAVGQVIEVPESQMDAVTGLSGSGPAYVALMIEALADGGVAVGLPRAIAQKLAIQTVLGTAILLQQSDLHPAELKDRVSSPGGTTIAGVTALERSGFRSAAIEAVKAAYHRSQELGN
ncbi:MAG TPA: pyrroline-5-carboxylate reductase [Xenococcaceae cyanobacterium]